MKKKMKNYRDEKRIEFETDLEFLAFETRLNPNLKNFLERRLTEYEAKYGITPFLKKFIINNNKVYGLDL